MRLGPPCSLQFRLGAGGGRGGGGLTALAVREAVPPPPARPRCNRSRQGAAHHHLPDLSGGSHRVPPRTQRSLSPARSLEAFPRPLRAAKPWSCSAGPRSCCCSAPLPALRTVSARVPPRRDPSLPAERLLRRHKMAPPLHWAGGGGARRPRFSHPLVAAAAAPSLERPGFNGWAVGGRVLGGAVLREGSRRASGTEGRLLGPSLCRLALGSAALMAARLLQRAPAQ